MPRRRKRSSSIFALALIALIVVLVFLSTPLGKTLLGWLNPGFEGAKCYFYGVQFNDWGDWEGTKVLHKYEDAESILVKKEDWYLGILWAYDKVYWGTTTQPSNPVIVHDWMENGGNIKGRLQLAIEIQSQIPLEDIKRNGDPLDWNETDPMAAKLIQYWTLEEEKISDNETRYKLVKKEVILCPGEFVIQIYIPPGNEHTTTGSGWQEGEWPQVQLWFIVFWHTWENALKPYLENDPEPPAIPDEAYDREVSFQYKGGAPITGWIQGFWKNIPTLYGMSDDCVKWDRRGKDGQATFTNEQLRAKLENLDAKVQLSPSLQGRFIDLFTDPSPEFSYPLPRVAGHEDIVNYAGTNVPDPTLTQAQYFSITINTLGTYVEGDFWSGWNVYYPCVYYRLRFIFAVYGEHTYLWTEETAEENKYPGWQNRTYVRVFTPGVFTGLIEWLSNPFNMLLLLLALIVVLLVVLAFFAPGVLAAISAIGSRTAQAIKPKHKRKKRPG